MAGYVFHVGVTEGAERDIECLWLLTISKNLASHIAKSNIVLKDSSRVWKRFSAVVRPPLTLGDAMCLSFNRCCQEAVDLSSQHYFPLARKAATGTEMRKSPGEWDCREPNRVPGQDSVGHESIPQLKRFAGENTALQFHSSH